MKGWVYVITNKAMTDLVKVGFSTKDPSLRAIELNNTGSPHPYEVQYTMLVEEPYQVEQQAHKRLTPKKEGKEWFRCTIEDAIIAIKHAAGDKMIFEDYLFKKKQEIENRYQLQIVQAKQLIQVNKQILEAQVLKEQELRKSIEAVESMLKMEEFEIQQSYDLLQKKLKDKLWNYYIYFYVIAFFLVFIIISFVSSMGWIALLITLIAIIHFIIITTKIDIIKLQHEPNLKNIRFRSEKCNHCKTKHLFNRKDFLVNAIKKSSVKYTCSACKNELTTPTM